jgi:hypothetical protein
VESLAEKAGKEIFVTILRFPCLQNLRIASRPLPLPPEKLLVLSRWLLVLTYLYKLPATGNQEQEHGKGW